MTDKDPTTPTLESLRDRIDAIDLEIQTLLNERAGNALQVATVKKATVLSARDATGTPGTQPAATGDNGTPPYAGTAPIVSFYRPEREAQILKKIASRNQGPMRDVHIQRIFREIISASLSLEEQLKIAYLGPQGTYSEEATMKHFGRSVVGVPHSSIADIFSAVEADSVRYGVVPVENSTEGTINHTLDLLMHTPLRICGEVLLRIQHQLLSQCTDLESVKAVHAHPQSLAQCRGWLDEHLPNADRVSESSNAAAAAIAVEDKTIAAIAGESAGPRYKLPALANNIEDVKTNTTRFLVIGKQDVPPSGDDATSLLISAPHKPGGLRRMLKPLEDAGISMTRIESRPGRTAMWEYVFFIDVSGHQSDETLAPVLDKLRDEAVGLRVLGSYPRSL